MMFINAGSLIAYIEAKLYDNIRINEHMVQVQILVKAQAWQCQAKRVPAKTGE